tara:strand:+ start:759 stop:1796 length:1038 start_codon:yes stop_codon:yes gene_type:complete
MITEKIKNWKQPSNWMRIETLDTHTAGEPLRIILGGFPDLKGETVLEKRSYLKDNYDNLRSMILSEPRGHKDMYGAVLVGPDNKNSDLGVIFIHNNGYSTGCGHAVIAIAKVIFEIEISNSKYFKPYIYMDVPSGRVRADAILKNNNIVGVSFKNVESFVCKLDVKLDINGLGIIKYDIAYGGAYYAIVNSQEVGLKCKPINQGELIKIGMKIKSAIQDLTELKCPIKKKYFNLYGTIFTGPPVDPKNHSRNVCVFADGQVDRSPTGTGVSARAAILYERGKITLNEELIIESIIGSTFKVSISEVNKDGLYKTVTPNVSGEAFIVARNSYILDPKDPYKNGFLI